MRRTLPGLSIPSPLRYNGRHRTGLPPSGRMLEVIKVRRIRRSEEPRFRALAQAQHYLGALLPFADLLHHGNRGRQIDRTSVRMALRR